MPSLLHEPMPGKPVLPLAGTIAQRAASDAEANVGVTEQGGENAGKYVETYLHAVGLRRGDPWCAAFVRYRFEQAAHALGQSLPAGFPDSGYCPDYQHWAKERHLWIPVADAKSGAAPVQRGDLCLFHFAAKNRVAHIGIVVGTMAGGVVNIEGNTAAETGTTVNRDGDGVYLKHRKWSTLGTGGGFARCPF